VVIAESAEMFPGLNQFGAVIQEIQSRFYDCLAFIWDNCSDPGNTIINSVYRVHELITQLEDEEKDDLVHFEL
jgi:hypothetical protein